MSRHSLLKPGHPFTLRFLILWQNWAIALIILGPTCRNRLLFGPLVIWTNCYLYHLLFGPLVIWTNCYLDHLLFVPLVIWTTCYLDYLLFRPLVILTTCYLDQLLFGPLVIICTTCMTRYTPLKESIKTGKSSLEDLLYWTNSAIWVL